MNILEITAGVFLGELCVSFFGMGVNRIVSARSAKKRQADLSAFSEFMLAKLAESDEAVAEEADVQ